jgi:hypothetical protein
MKTKLFSAFAASELLARDRQTIARALRGIPPDGKERGAPRWKMSTIFDAMERHNRANDGNSAGSNSAATAANPPEYAEYDRAFAALEALQTVEARRKAAIKIMPALHGMVAALRKQGHEVGQHPEHVDLRGDRVYQLMMLGFQRPCEWSHDEVWHNLNHVGYGKAA